MRDAIALPLALILLAGTLLVALARPPRVPEAGAAALGALVLVLVGAIGLSAAGSALRALGPTVGFLAALLLIAEGCRREGLFAALGEVMAGRAGGSPRRLLALVFAAATAVTIVLGLDATVVLLPPIVLATTARLRAAPRGPLYACAHLANSASLLLPVSNLTNLLAFRASGLSFAHFAVLMALPTVAVVAVEWAVISRWAQDAPRAAEGAAGDGPSGDGPAGQGLRADGAAPPVAVPPVAVPRFALAVLAATLAGFALSSAVAVDPIWVAIAGAAVINLPALVSRRTRPVALLGAVEPGFLSFVLGLGVIVATATHHGLGAAVRDVLPAGTSLGDLLLVAAISAVLANLVNNLPATLILVPVAAARGAGPVLAVLIGVNVGPNLAHVGSLATLLWRRVLAAAGVAYPAREFVVLGAMTVPPAIVLATLLLWLGLRL
ncbi:MAG TPA: SLC13 family permease [Solirubrobacteraceae bacterium]|nr:SLC13 family permease [Solirubrobacteraceae bacterium]